MPPGKTTAKQAQTEELAKQSLKAAVWYTVTKICQEEGTLSHHCSPAPQAGAEPLCLTSTELNLPFAASEHFVASLSELVFQQALSMGKDLESFAKHAGRTTVNVDDVKLLARRNEPLYDQLCTSATTHGLALSDLKNDSKPKLKLARATNAKSIGLDSKSTTSTSKKKETEKETSKKKESTSSKKGKGKEAVGKGKGKGKQVDSSSEEEDSDSSNAPPAKKKKSTTKSTSKGNGGGFMSAKEVASTSSSKRRRITASSDEEEEEEEDELEDDEEDERGRESSFDSVLDDPGTKGKKRSKK
ncbi:CENP-S family protein [Sporobolomyces salmoneus]|uniref:CENP-S family protein n=1 Tax=Sporobolomyces salmoneus TaxID=183962 RepID=UPI0031734DB1